jgi:glutamate formiminotransferase
VHLLGRARLVIPQWEPDMGWRVLDPDGHVVDAGPRTYLVAEYNLATLGLNVDEVPELGTGQERSK